jgi:L-iditol 2-dehydrogenase
MVHRYEGTLQRYKCHPAKWCHKIPDNLTYAQGALLEPLSVVMHGIEEAGLKLGRGCVIHGAGPIGERASAREREYLVLTLSGLIALAAARASGAHPIVITDVEPKRLAFAQEFIPSCQTYLVDTSLDVSGNATAIRNLFGVSKSNEYAAPTVALECTGVESSVCTAAYVVRRGGCVMVIGVGRSIMNNLPFMELSLAEVGLPQHSLMSLTKG